MSKPSLLFLTPTMPSYNGSGLAIRARANLEALAKRFDVDVVVLGADRDQDASHLSGVCRNVAQECLEAVQGVAARQKWSRLRRKIATLLSPLPYEAGLYSVAAQSLRWPDWSAKQYSYIFAFRIRLTPLALAAARRIQGGAAKLVLDMDDIESRVFEAGGRPAARLGRAKLARLERRMMQRFDLTLVCSEQDRRILQQESKGARVAVVPNIAPPTATGEPTGERCDVPLLLFVGLLKYGPNASGIAWFCREVLPIIQATVDSRIRVAVVGRDPSPAVLALGEIPGVTVVGEVQETGSWFARSDLMIVPLHAGGGTRIKILEAFARGCPVVSTSVGARGLGLADGVELLLADTAKDFASACGRVITQPELREGLISRATQRVSHDYTQDALERCMTAAFAECAEAY